MKIITKRLILRPWKESDASSLFEYAKDPSVGPIAGWPVHTSISNSLDIIKNVLQQEETYAVCLKENNTAIGSIGLIPSRQAHTFIRDNEVEVGYWIGFPFFGNGYIKEVLKAIQRHVFKKLGYKAMCCVYYDGNLSSKRCMEKCGFKYHHTELNRSCELTKDTRTIHFAYLTKDEWLNLNKGEE